MRQIEVKLRAGMATRGITGATAEQIIRSIASFALYGFPESHAASFALIVYASAYLKAHFPAAFYTALLNNQPMGFYHPATLVKDAQRHGMRFACIDVQRSSWECTVEPSGAIRLGLQYVAGLREEVGRAMARPRVDPPRDRPGPTVCPKCGCDDRSMLEVVRPTSRGQICFCSTCAHDWEAPIATPDIGVDPPRRFASLAQLIARTGVNRGELATLAEIGALEAFGKDRRSALWQIERAVRPAGRLFETETESTAPAGSPLRPMTPVERVIADYAGTGLTVGPHPMALRRAELAMRGVLRSTDLSSARHGRRVRIAGAVITRQRPGTAKGFVFLTLEDETGIANIIVRPDLFDRQRLTIVGEPFLLVEGTLQQQEGVTSVKADRVQGFAGATPETPSHDFH
jgi:error-prone DNA polymerase